MTSNSPSKSYKRKRKTGRNGEREEGKGEERETEIRRKEGEIRRQKEQEAGRE